MTESAVKVLEYFMQKEEEYQPFDPQRFKKLFEMAAPKIKAHFKKDPPFIIQIVGTNGKGSTGRFLSLMLLAAKQTVGHFTSPHLLDLKERFWNNGQYVASDCLLKAHECLQGLFSEEQDVLEQASYFEYATLLAYVLFYPYQYAVMETGLGGEFDATTCLLAPLTLITPIAYDHQDMLGDHITMIAQTKLKAIHKQAIIGVQPFYDEVAELLCDLSKERQLKISYLEEYDKLNEVEYAYLKQYHLPSYQVDNFRLAKKGMQILGLDYSASCLQSFDLNGRCQQVRDHIYIDVGHNVHAAEYLCAFFEGQTIDLIYNSYRDKDYKTILKIFKPLIRRLHILELPHNRMVPIQDLKNVLQELKIPYDFNCAPLESKTIYLVFGSFSVAQAFILQYLDTL